MVILAFGIAVIYVVIPVLLFLVFSTAVRVMIELHYFVFSLRFFAGLIAGIVMALAVFLVFTCMKKHAARRMINKFLRH